jgi:hypothetical protein
MSSTSAGWRTTRRVRQAIAGVLGGDDERIDRTLELVKSQNDY